MPKGFFILLYAFPPSLHFFLLLFNFFDTIDLILSFASNGYFMWYGTTHLDLRINEDI